MTTQYISNWEAWKELCKNNNLDPYETIEFGIDEGGGNSTDFEYIGESPKVEEKDPDEEWKNVRDAYSGEREEE